jgi:hypothetical protein
VRKRPRDSGLYGSFGRDVESSAFAGQPQQRTARIAAIGSTSEQPTSLEPREDTREGARMNVQQPCEVARRQSREPPDDPQDQSLRSRDAQGAVHLLRGPLQGLIDRPDQTHEVEHLTQRRDLCRAKGGRRGLRDRSAL